MQPPAHEEHSHEEDQSPSPPLVLDPQLWAAHIRPLAQLKIPARLPTALAYFNAYERYQRDNGSWWEWFDERLADLPAEHPTAWLVRFERARHELQRAGGRLAAAAKLAQRCLLPGRDPPAALLALFAALHARLAARPTSPPHARSRAVDFAAAARPALSTPPALPLAERLLLLHARGLQLLLVAEQALGLPPNSELAAQAARWSAMAERAHLPGLVALVRAGVVPATVVEGALGQGHPQALALALLLQRLADEQTAPPGPGPCAFWRGLLLAQPGPHPPAMPPADPAALAAASSTDLPTQLRELEAAAQSLPSPVDTEPLVPAESQLTPTTTARSPARAIAVPSRTVTAGAGLAALEQHEIRRTRLVRLQGWGDQLRSGAAESLVRSFAAAPELQPRAQQLALLRAPRPARPVQAPPGEPAAAALPARPALSSAPVTSPAPAAVRSPTYAVVPSAKPSSAPLQAILGAVAKPQAKIYRQSGEDSDSSAEGSNDEDEDTVVTAQPGTQQPFVLARPAFQLPAGSGSGPAPAPTTPSLFGATFGQPAQLGTAAAASISTSTPTVAASPLLFGTRGPALDFAGLAKPLTLPASSTSATNLSQPPPANVKALPSPFGSGFGAVTVSFGPAATRAATTSTGPNTSSGLLTSTSKSTGPIGTESLSATASGTSSSTPSISLTGNASANSSASTSATALPTSSFSFGSFGAPDSSAGNSRSSRTATTLLNSLPSGSFGSGSSISFSFSPTTFGSSSAATSSAWLPPSSSAFAAPAPAAVSVFTTATTAFASASTTAASTGPFRPAGADAARIWEPQEGSDTEGQDDEQEEEEEEEEQGEEADQDDEEEQDDNEQDSGEGEHDKEEEEAAPSAAATGSLGMRVRARQQPSPAAVSLAPLGGAFASTTSNAAAAAAAAALFAKPPPSASSAPLAQPFNFAGPLKFELRPPDDDDKAE